MYPFLPYLYGCILGYDVVEPVAGQVKNLAHAQDHLVGACKPRIKYIHTYIHTYVTVSRQYYYWRLNLQTSVALAWYNLEFSRSYRIRIYRIEFTF